MADFQQAVKWMKEGKKVRTPSYNQGDYSYINEDGVMLDNLGNSGLNLELLEATNWVIYCEEHDWGIAGQEYTEKEGTSYYLICKNCGFKKKESPKESLSDKIEDIGEIDPVEKCGGGWEVCHTKDIKEKIQNAQKRLKHIYDEGSDGFSDVDKIFKEEFGGKFL